MLWLNLIRFLRLIKSYLHLKKSYRLTCVPFSSYGCFRKRRYPQIIHFNRVFHYFHHPFWGTTILGNPQISFAYACQVRYASYLFRKVFCTRSSDTNGSRRTVNLLILQDKENQCQENCGTSCKLHFSCAKLTE